MTVIQHLYSKSARMQAIVDKFDEYERKKAWNTVYMNIQNSSEAQAQDLGLTYDIANKEQNQVKNRYCNVIPYDQNLLELQSVKNFYINASPMKVEITGRDYIFAQGPLENTSSDFWRMVYEKETNIIVMLTDCVEWGQKKCHEYFPMKNETTKKFGNYSLELLDEEANEWYIIRKLKLTPKKGTSTEPRTIHHYQFINWPDFGVPEDSTSFTAFVEAVRNLDDTFEVHTPIVCHCSAGIGRTGTFTVVDILLTALRNGNTDDLPMIDDLVLKMRTSRMYLVQTPAQLRFSWKSVVDWIRKEDTMQNEPIEEAIKSGDELESELPETNGDSQKDSRGKITFSPGKRASTDEDMIKINERREKIKNMREKLKRVEEWKVRRDYWFNRLPYIVGSASLIGFASFLIYRYVGSGDPENFS